MLRISSILFEYGTYTIAYLAAYVASLAELLYLAGGILAAEAIFLFIYWQRMTKNLVDLRGLFTLAWVGGQAIACLKLSNLQSDWSPVTWLCFFLIYIGFGLGYEWKKELGKKVVMQQANMKNQQYAPRLLVCIITLMIVSILCFLFEAFRVQFIPLFSDKPHAYSYFHVSGVHYFTISCILIPAITVLCVKLTASWNWKNILLLVLGNATAVAIPILCVSRFQLLFAVGFAVVTYVLTHEKVKLKMIVGLLIIMVPVYVLLTVARNHDVTYLNGIFDMKNSNMPIFITQPYMYVANNFENFNCMVTQIAEHTWGLKMLFPVFALSGLKFIFPQLVSFPIFITKPELTTLTMFYDAYYDFGIAGVLIFAIIIGFAAKQILNWVKRSKNPITCLFYGQMAIYLGLAFFTTWFSNPTTWFWLVLTGMMYVYVGYVKKEERQKADE